MKARLLKKFGSNYAGQILTNVEKDSLPAGVAEYFEDDDPAVNTVREPSTGSVPEHTVNNDEVAPLRGSDFAKAQEAKVKAVEKQHDAAQTASADVLNTNVGTSAKAPVPQSAESGNKANE